MAGASGSGVPPHHLLHSQTASSNTSRRSTLPTSGVLRIQHELHTLLRDPVPFIYVYADDEDITKISAFVIGPLETPYAGGFFRFDIRVGAEYPMNPPRVILQTTDGGRVRFNPNLYADGKVCLSILGTWAGPAWSSAESLSSVLLSIQSLMCPEPYHNEPGYEHRGDAAVKSAYNDYVRYETLRVAVVGTLKHTAHAAHFPDVLERLFLVWYDMYITVATDLHTRLEGKPFKDVFSARRGRYDVLVLLNSLKAMKRTIMDRMNALDRPLPSTDATNPGSPMSESDKTSLTYAADRLQDEYRNLLRHPPPGGSASPRDVENPFVWDATILGPENTPWEGGLFSLVVRFSCQHPYRPPFARFTSKMFHPNITSEGIPALDSIQTRWNSNTRVSTILDELQAMLASPSPTYPVNQDAAHLYRVNRREYERRIRRLAQDGC